uniref:eCIS core domain-containing protein n=1 Tax=uncultured Sphingomonas sp. TaxID=158754 RepID=UPI0035CC20F8
MSGAKARSPGNLAGGQSVPAPLRARAERSLGVPLSAVRVHRENREAHAMGAAGVSRGQQILLAPGADEATLAHELVHVAQGARHGTLAGAPPTDTPGSGAESEADRLASAVLRGEPAPVSRPRDARTHREPAKGKKTDPEMVIVPVGANQGSLAAYPMLRNALDPAEWNALSAAARRRGESIAGEKPDKAKDEAVRNEVTVPLHRLLRPTIPLASQKTGSDALKRDLYQLGVAGAGPGSLGMRIQREIIALWVEGDIGLLLEPVTIALIDPEAKGKGSASLVFTLRGNPVPSADGSLAMAAVDKALNGYLSGIVTMIQSEVEGAEAAINAAVGAKAVLDTAKAFAAKGDDDLAGKTLDEIDAALRLRAADAAKISEAPYAGLIGALAGELRGYADGAFAQRRAAHTKWVADNEPRNTVVGTTADMLEESWKKDKTSFETMMLLDAASHSFGADVGLKGGADLKRHELTKAFREGTITYKQFDEAATAVEHRGWIVGGINAALMIATLGLGGIGEIGFGASVALGGGVGIVSAVTPMIASNLYTTSTNLSDPQMQAWWKGSAYSTSDIVKAGLIGGGIGAGFPIAGKALSLIGGRGAAPVAAGLAAESELTSLKGVASRSLPGGGSELTIASEGITIQRADGMVRVYGPAGNAKRVLLSSFRADELSDVAAATGGATAPGSTNLFGNTTGGTGSTPFRFGTGASTPWVTDPIGGVSGGPRGMIVIPSGGGSRMIPGASGGMAMAGPGEAMPMIMPSADMPVPFLDLPGVARPPAVLPGAEPFAPFVDLPGQATSGPAYLPGLDPTGGGGAYFPGMPGAPMLASGVQYIGPITPNTFRNPLGMIRGGRPVNMMQLPQTALGGQWILDGSGLWRYVAYPGSPADAPGGITNYGAGDAQDLILRIPGLQGALVQPNDLNFAGGRGYPMTTAAMRYGSIVLARSHLGPHADTKIVLPGGMSSTRDPENYVGHPRKYNERIRRTLEARLRKDGFFWSAYDELGDTARVTQGGFTVPVAETITQYGADGQPMRAWRFPFDNLSAYENLPGNIDDILANYEIAPRRGSAGR